MTAIHRPGAGPTVVFVAQLGTGGSSWQPIIDRLPNQAVFAYDRPGTGDAPARPAPNRALSHGFFANELGAMLEQYRVAGPLILAGHSLGGNIVRVFAGRHLRRIAGLVYIDSSIPQTVLTPDQGPSIDGDGPDATTVDTVAGHLEILSAPIPDVPTVAMTRTMGAWGGQWDPPHPAVEPLWHLYQHQLAERHRAPLVATRNTGHQIPGEAPDLTAYVIQAVATAAQGGEKRVKLDPDVLDRHGGHIDN